MIVGIDVSHHQADTPSLSGQSFLIARAAWGDQPDRMYASHIAAARRRGLLTGAYLFLRPGSSVSIRAQVAAFLERAGDVDGYAVDREPDARSGGKQASRLETRQALELIRREHPRVGLYASSANYIDAGQDWRWVADYRGHEPPIPWDVWQWTSFVGGVHLDRNRYRGTRDELRRLWRGPDQEEPPVPQLRTFAIEDGATSGKITVTEPDHWYLRQLDWSLQGPIDHTQPAWHDRPAYGPIRLVPDQPGHEGKRWFLIGTNAAFVREDDVQWTPDPDATDRNAVLDEAIAAVEGIKG